MDFYDLLAPWYDDLFPPDPQRLSFLKGLLPDGPGRFLDVGCGTGATTGALAAAGHDAVGIDLNARLLEIARHKARKDRVRVEFRLGDMADPALQSADEPPYDLITCLGNTVPHLPTRAAIRVFLADLRSRLAPGGHLVLQILNYDRRLRERPAGLPTITTDDGTAFHRFYDYGPLADTGHLIFLSQLVAADGTEIGSSTKELLPLRREEMTEDLASAGFSTTVLYGDWEATPADGQESFIVYLSS